MAVVERISHRVAVMYLGQIVEIGPRRAIFENPQHPYTRKLIAAVPVADPARRRRKSELSSEEMPSPFRAVGDEPVVAPLVRRSAPDISSRRIRRRRVLATSKPRKHATRRNQGITSEAPHQAVAPASALEAASASQRLLRITSGDCMIVLAHAACGSLAAMAAVGARRQGCRVCGRVDLHHDRPVRCQRHAVAGDGRSRSTKACSASTRT